MNETKWLTVAEASLLARKMGLNRTHKTIRSWCRGDHVTAEKQTNRTGEIWVVDRESLIIKINSEIEFRDQQRRGNPMRTPFEPVQTGSDQYKPVRTGAHMDEPRSSQSVSEGAEALSAQIAHLKMEVKFNEKLADQFKKEYLKGQEALQAQARYIGHIETNLAQLGGKSDQTFLAAPVPSSERSREVREQAKAATLDIVQNQYPHPDQTGLYTG